MQKDNGVYKLLRLLEKPSLSCAELVPGLDLLIAALEEISPAKEWSSEYIDSICFRKERDFSNDQEYRLFSRVGVVVAADQLREIRDHLSDTKSQGLNVSKEQKSLLINYIFDIKNEAEFLMLSKYKEKRCLFEGGKNYLVESFQFARVANNLFYRASEPVELNAARATSIFAMRQALESLFQRCIGIYLVDRHGKTPKLRHGFHLNFIADNPDFFSLPESAKSITQAYAWSNDIVHGGYQPLVWQAARFLQKASRFFEGGAYQSGIGYSVHGSIQVSRVSEMQQGFIRHFISEYDHGIWSVHLRTPEAGFA